MNKYVIKYSDLRTQVLIKFVKNTYHAYQKVIGKDDQVIVVDER